MWQELSFLLVAVGFFVISVEGAVQTTPDGWLIFQDHAYFFKGTKSTWAAASNTCKKLGGSLASVSSADENLFIATEVNKNTDARIWLGGFFNNDSFNWIDGTPFTYGNTNLTCNNGCLWLRQDTSAGMCIGQGVSNTDIERTIWTTQSCTSTRKFVCKKEYASGANSFDDLYTNRFVVGNQTYISVNDEGKLEFLTRRPNDYGEGYTIPTALSPFITNGMITVNGATRDATTLTFEELRSALIEKLGLTGDPFESTRRFTITGETCPQDDMNDFLYDHDACSTIKEDNFIAFSAHLRDYSSKYFDAPHVPQAGMPDYQGAIKNITVVSATERINENKVEAGSPRFRLLDEEVDDVYFMELKKQRHFEVFPSVIHEIWGFRGGKVEDFAFDTDGHLVGGFVVVGPHPMTDPNDVVHYGDKRYGDFGFGYTGPNPSSGLADSNNYTAADGVTILKDASPFSDLEVRAPGPEIRFMPDRRVRIYVKNSMETEHLALHFHGFDNPHDQDGIAFNTQYHIMPGTTYVYEFVVPNGGTRWYHQHFDTPDGVAQGIFGACPGDYPSELKIWDREYLTVLHDGLGRFTMNGNSFPGTVERLSGQFRDVMRIISSERAADLDSSDPYPDDVIVTIDDSPRDTLKNPTHPNRFYNDPSAGGPIRPGTGYVDEFTNERKHAGHNILHSQRDQGLLVEIADHDLAFTFPYASLNGHHFVTRYRNSTTKIRVPKVGQYGSLKPGQTGSLGYVRIWRKHKSSRDQPTLQNNGNSGAYFKVNDNEVALLRWANSANTHHPIHLHGHQWKVIAQDGNLFDTPSIANAITINSGMTADVVLRTRNPNQAGAWMFHCHILNHLINPDNPWPGAGNYPGGMLTVLDYTGYSHGRLAIDTHHHYVPLRLIPPGCEASPESKTVGRDLLGNVRDLENNPDITLSATVTISSNKFTQRPMGELLSTTWSIVSVPTGASLPTIANMSSTTTVVSGFTEDGEYKFQLKAIAQNFDRATTGGSISDTVECSTIQTIVVTSKVVSSQKFGHIYQSQDLANVYAPSDIVEKAIVAYKFHEGQTVGSHRITVADSLLGKTETYLPYVLDATGSIDSYANSDGSRVIARVPRDPRVSIKPGISYSDFSITAEDDLGTIVLPLIKAQYRNLTKIGNVYMVALEASDLDFADLIGARYAPELASITSDACDLFARYNATSNLFTVTTKPSDVPFPASGEANNLYSPLKRFLVNGKFVTVNMPTVVWGGNQAPNSRLLVDNGGCDPNIRSGTPLSNFTGGGPPECTAGESPLSRYYGGQALSINLVAQTVTMKLHRTYLNGKKVSYHSVFDASDRSTADYLGVPWTPKLQAMGRSIYALRLVSPTAKTSSFTPSPMFQFGNGAKLGKGAARFQSPIGVSDQDSSFKHVMWAYLNCGVNKDGDVVDGLIGRDVSLYMPSANIGKGDTPSMSVPNFHYSSVNYDPYQLNKGLKGTQCPGYAAYVANNDDGSAIISSFDQLAEMIKQRTVFATDAPGGVPLGFQNIFSILNAPSLAIADLNVPVPLLVKSQIPQPIGSWILFERNDAQPNLPIKVLYSSTDSFTSTPPTSGWKFVYNGTAAPFSLFSVSSNGFSEISYIITATSDPYLAETFGFQLSSSLASIPEEACEYLPSLNSSNPFPQYFTQLPGILATNVSRAEGNPLYSSIKRVFYNHTLVTFNIVFVAWSSEKLIIDTGGCIPEIRSVDFDPANPATSSSHNGPPGCLPGDEWDERFFGGQLLSYDVTNRIASMKAHHMLNIDENAVPFVSVFESSNLDLAELFGVPHVPRIARALDLDPGASFTSNFHISGLNEMFHFGNGIEDLADAHGFQDSVIASMGTSGNASPLSRWILLKYVCDSSDVDCANMALELSPAGDGYLYYNDLKSIFANSPSTFSVITSNIVVNAPIPFYYGAKSSSTNAGGDNLVLNMTASGSNGSPIVNRVHLFGSDDDATTWYYQIDSGSASRLAPSSFAAVTGGSSPVVHVNAGDTVIFTVDTSLPHSVILAQKLASHTKTALEELQEILEIDTGASSTLSLVTQSKFSAAFGIQPIGSQILFTSGSPLTLLKGKVKPGNAGKSLIFSCVVHGPTSMGGILTVDN